MEVFHEIKTLKGFLREKRKENFMIGFVPTMGALHAGHLSLINKAKIDGCFTVSSIFVNPAQFNNSNDLANYPRTLNADTALLQNARCDVLFVPSADEMYSTESILKFDFGHLENTMEGRFRPGHFSGVALVVSKLFHIIEADHAYFGQKDWQQFIIIQQLVKDLNFNLSLHVVPTLREVDGLAMSSRNQRLTVEQRRKAIVFYNMLQIAEQRLKIGNSIDAVQLDCKRQIEQDPELKLEYLELVNRTNLLSLKTVESAGQSVLCIAGFVGEVRLIDNLLL
jgi:pantoate--beta-alanine ligase